MPTLISRAVIASTVMAGLGLVGSTFDAQAAAATCHGQHATIVGKPNSTFHGTDHRDVIVTNGSSGRARGGPDLICITGHENSRVDAGPGRDVVDGRALATPSTLVTAVVLGTGADHYQGSPGFDYVTAGARDNRRDTAHDVIITGRRMDEVTSGTQGHPNNDTVKTGPDRDTVEMLGIPVGAHVDGGRGANFLTPYVGRPKGDLTLDIAGNVMKFEGRKASYVHHFYDLTFSYPPSGRLTIRHDNRDPGYTYLRNQLGTANVTYHLDLSLGRDARLHSGPDARLVGRASARSTSSMSTLQMTSHARHSASLDLDGWGTWDGHRSLHLSGFRWVTLFNSRDGVQTTIQGTSASEHIAAFAFGGLDILRGAAGDDELSSGLGDDQLFGGEGDDTLLGGPDDDVLDGGDGDDRLDGGPGTDRCSAELVMTGCELPLT
jgi:Ca2+-binding RTX toxin-like protein